MIFEVTQQDDEQSSAQKRKRGFTLTEIAIVLGIVGLILSAIWTAASAVYSNQRVAHATTAILQIAQGVRTLYASQATTGYTAATDITSMLVSSGVTPSDLGNTDPLTGPFAGGQTGVYATDDSIGFGISMSNVPAANCSALISAIAGTSRDSGLFAATAVTTAAPSASDFTSTGTPLSAPITPASAVTTCTGTGGTTTITMDKVKFGFTLK